MRHHLKAVALIVVLVGLGAIGAGSYRSAVRQQHQQNLQRYYTDLARYQAYEHARALSLIRLKPRRVVINYGQ